MEVAERRGERAGQRDLPVVQPPWVEHHGFTRRSPAKDVEDPAIPDQRQLSLDETRYTECGNHNVCAHGGQGHDFGVSVTV